MEDLLLDIRYALRVLWKSPSFTLVALITLMLGIGANVVVFGLVNAVLLRPLEVSDPKNLYQLRLGSWTNWKLLTTSYPAFEDYQRRNTTFSAIAGFDGYCSATLHSDNIARSVSGYAVTGNYFDMLGVHPQLGRLIRGEDDLGANSAPYFVLSDILLRSAFNADPRVIGTTVRLNKDPFTVLGVAPPQFHGTEQFDWPDYFIPIVNYFDSDYLRNRTGHPLTVLGRLKPGVTPQQAAENLSSIAAQLAKEYPQTDTGLPLRLVRPGLHADTGDVIRSSLYSVTALALQVRRSSPLHAMKSGAVNSMPLRRFTSRDLMLGAQISICTLMVTSSIVAVRGMVRMLHTPLGFQPKGAMLAEIDLTEVEPQGA